MDMPDNLTSPLIGIIDNTEAIFGKAGIVSDLACNLVDMADQFIIGSRQIQRRTDMLPGYDQEMVGRLGVDILDDDDLIILVNKFSRDFPGYNFTEDAIVRHVLLPLLRCSCQHHPHPGEPHASVLWRHVSPIPCYD